MDKVITHSHTVVLFSTLSFFSIEIITYSAYRKCKITLRGPWQQVPPIRLSDISLMPCLAQSRMEHVPVWALSDKGDVLCRLGVSPQNPAVRTEKQIVIVNIYFWIFNQKQEYCLLWNKGKNWHILCL